MRREGGSEEGGGREGVRRGEVQRDMFSTRLRIHLEIFIQCHVFLKEVPCKVFIPE